MKRKRLSKQASKRKFRQGRKGSVHTKVRRNQRGGGRL